MSDYGGFWRRPGRTLAWDQALWQGSARLVGAFWPILTIRGTLP
jgi:hypothetical protein